MINTSAFTRLSAASSVLCALFGLAAIVLSQTVAAAPQTPPLSMDELYAQGQRDLPSSWRGVGKSHDAAVFMHQDRRRESDGRIAVWLHRELMAQEYFEKEKPYLSLRERLLADCKAGRLGITDVTYYGERFAKGAVAGTSKYAAPEMKDPVPDSIDDQILRNLCPAKARQAPAQRQKAPQ